jgi:hypothetical protein
MTFATTHLEMLVLPVTKVPIRWNYNINPKVPIAWHHLINYGIMK